MSNQQWWVKTGGPTIGPISSNRLRELAISGFIIPKTLISKDNQNWVPAQNARGLFEGTSQASGHPPRQSDQAESSSNRQSSDDHSQDSRSLLDTTIRYPVLRIRRRFLRYEILAIYETHLIKGTRFRRSLPITEEMCHPSGESALSRLFLNSLRIDYAEVADFRELYAKRKKPIIGKAAVNPNQLNSYKLILFSGQNLKFSIPTFQSATVREAFSFQLGNRYWVARSRMVDGISTTLLVILAFLPIVGWLFLLFLLPWKLLTRKRRDWKPAHEVLGDAIEAPSKKPRNPNRSRNPFRSLVLGWSLKFLGLFYWILIASPITDGFNERLLEVTKNNWQVYSVAWTLIWAPAGLLIYTGYQLCQRRYKPASTADSRKPILFLRPFEDDSTTTLQPPGLLSGLSGIRSRSMSYQWNNSKEGGRIGLQDLIFMSHPVRLLRMVLDYGVGTSEETLVRYFEVFGPVVAIGKPGERLATPGASRVYVADTQWQQTILTELERSQAIVVQPGSTAGVRWELEQIRNKVEPFRVLLCLVSYWRNPQAYESFERIARESFRINLPRVVPYLERPSFLYFDGHWNPQIQELSYKNPVFWSLTTEAADLDYTLRPFMQGMHGGERELPRRPRWARGLRKQLCTSVGAVLALVVSLAPVLGVHYVGSSLGFVTGSTASPTKPGQLNTSNSSSVQLATAVDQSPKVTLRGQSLPYQLDVPEGLVKVAPDEAMIEHSRKSSDGRMIVQVIAIQQTEDMSNLAQERLNKNSGEGIRESKLESARTVSQAGVDWTESRMIVIAQNGMAIREIARGTSGPNGSILIIIDIVSFPESDPIYMRLTDEILRSFRFVGRSGLGVVTAPPPKTKEIFKPDDFALEKPSPAEVFRLDEDAPKKTAPPVLVRRGSTQKGPVWSEQDPRGHYLLNGDKIRLVYGQSFMAAEPGKLLPAWGEVTEYAGSLDSDLHVDYKAFYFALLDRQSLLILKYVNLDKKQEGYLAVYRAKNGSFYSTTNGNAAWKPIEPGMEETQYWQANQSGQVYIEIFRPSINGDEQGRDIDYRFSLKKNQ